MTDTDRMVRDWRMMGDEEVEQLVRILQQLPTTAGFLISKAIDMQGAPLMADAYCARVILSGGGGGMATDDNPARALRAAWGLAHLEMAEKLRPPMEKKA